MFQVQWDPIFDSSRRCFVETNHNRTVFMHNKKTSTNELFKLEDQELVNYLKNIKKDIEGFLVHKFKNRIYLMIDDLGTYSLHYILMHDRIFLSEYYYKNSVLVTPDLLVSLTLDEYNNVSIDEIRVERKIASFHYNLTTLQINSIDKKHNENQDQIVNELSVVNSLRASVVSCVESTDECIHVLFSGGIDSTVLVCILAEITNKPINLYNVSFESAYSNDRITALLSFMELKRLYAGKNINLYLKDVNDFELDAQSEKILNAINPLATVIDYTIASLLYFGGKLSGYSISDEEDVKYLLEIDSNESVVRLCRLYNIFILSDDCENTDASKNINRTDAGTSNINIINTDSTDKTCLKCKKYKYSEKCNFNLCRKCCYMYGKEIINYRCRKHCSEVSSDLEVNTKACNEKLIKRWNIVKEKLEFKCNSHLSGKLIIGSGADELFGGYHKYKSKFFGHNFDEWRSQLIHDVKNIWNKNLLRDHRVILASGFNENIIAIKYPYLKYDLVQLIQRINSLSLIYGFEHEIPDGRTKNNQYSYKINKKINEKKILRDIASKRLNLNITARFKKKAMQFGSGSSKMYSKNDPRPNRQINAFDELIFPKKTNFCS